MQEGKNVEAGKYINAALKISPDYPNANLTLALLFEKQDELDKAFDQAIKSLSIHKKPDQVHQGMLTLAYSVA